MRNLVGLIVVVLLLSWSIPQTIQADISLGLKFSDDGVKSFYLAVGDHYKVPEKELIVVQKKNIPEEELPVIFFIAGQAGVGSNAVIKLRLGGKSWMDICVHYGLTSDIFYVPVAKVSGPPYGKAYGHFKNKKKDKWRTIRLSDSEIVDFVNLRFISEHYGYSPEDVIKMRSEGKGFVAINKTIKKNKNHTKGKKSKQFVSEEKSPKKNKGKGKK